MELLTILYALLAAVTGIGGGERTAMVDPGVVSASASSACAAERGAASAARRMLAAKRVRPPLRIAQWIAEPRARALPGAPAMPRLAGFANRRQ